MKISSINSLILVLKFKVITDATFGDLKSRLLNGTLLENTYLQTKTLNIVWQ